MATRCFMPARAREDSASQSSPGRPSQILPSELLCSSSGTFFIPGRRRMSRTVRQGKEILLEYHASLRRRAFYGDAIKGNGAGCGNLQARTMRSRVVFPQPEGPMKQMNRSSDAQVDVVQGSISLPSAKIACIHPYSSRAIRRWTTQKYAKLFLCRSFCRFRKRMG